LNWYRQSELEGALLLGRLARHVDDPYLVHQLTKHCADEARHAWLWQRTLTEMSLPAVRIRRSYQSFYADETAAPRGLLEALALTHVFELRVHAHFSDELRKPDVPEAVRRTYRSLLRDEDGHLDWIGRWLATQEGVERILGRYRAADQHVIRRLEPYGDRLWDVQGLGEELAEKTDDDIRHPEEERHSA
jgi:tRNA isopentenyl-2-thiomethyl-A-37 hydroxylase MiaE